MNTQPNTHIKIHNRIAYHQAVHAVAIYLGNKQKQLPAVHFQIVIKTQPRDDGQQSDRFMRPPGKYTAIVEGGRLIQSLPLSFTEDTLYFSWAQTEECLCAFEADVINLLAGSLAEAKYIASRDGEVFTANLINLNALHFYGGSSDIEVISEYLECFIPDKADRERKLPELFLAAFGFVNKSSNWRAISTLADYIRDYPIGTIPCEDVISLLDSCDAACNGPTNNETLKMTIVGT